MKWVRFGLPVMLLLVSAATAAADAPADADTPPAPPSDQSAAPASSPTRSKGSATAVAGELPPPFPDVTGKAPEVVIEGKRNPFTESDENLRRLRDGLPDLDSSLKKPEGPGLASALLHGFLPTEPPPKRTDSADRADEQGLHGVCAAGNQWGCVYRDQDP